jgi:uncharacterized glyoxalase superfamily protein PhnB
MSQAIFPSLRYRDAMAAIEWLERAFGFERHEVHTDGETVVHAELAFRGSLVMMGSAKEDGFGSHEGQGWQYLVTDDPDGLFERATAAGAEVVRGLSDQDYGSRDFSVRDPEGNLWSFGTYQPEV